MGVGCVRTSDFRGRERICYLGQSWSLWLRHLSLGALLVGIAVPSARVVVRAGFGVGSGTHRSGGLSEDLELSVMAQ